MLLYRVVLHVLCHLFFYASLCVVKHKKGGDKVHEVQLCSKAYTRGDNVHEVQLCVVKYFMYIVTSFLYFTTHSCTSCTLSPLFYISLHRAVLHAHCHLLCMLYYRVVLHVLCHLFYYVKKEVTMYMKYNCV
jgi:hypothetical protein